MRHWILTFILITSSSCVDPITNQIAWDHAENIVIDWEQYQGNLTVFDETQLKQISYERIQQACIEMSSKR